MIRTGLAMLGFVLALAFIAGVAGYRLEAEGSGDLIPWGMMVAGYVFYALASGGVFDSMAIRILSGERLFGVREVRYLAWSSIALLVPGILLVFSDILHPERFYNFYTSFQVESRIAWNAILYLAYAAMAFLFLAYIIRRGFNPESRTVRVLLAAGLASSLLLEANLGMAYGINVAVPAWYASMAPMVFVAASLVLGSSFSILVSRFYQARAGIVESYVRELRYTLLALVFIVGWSMVAMAGWGDARETVSYMISRVPYALFFWVGFVLLGVVIPSVLAGRNPSGAAVASILGIALYISVVFNFIPQYSRLFTNPMYNLLAGPRLEHVGLAGYLLSYETVAFIGGVGVWLLLQLYGLKLVEAIMSRLSQHS